MLNVLCFKLGGSLVSCGCLSSGCLSVFSVVVCLLSSLVVVCLLSSLVVVCLLSSLLVVFFCLLLWLFVFCLLLWLRCRFHLVILSLVVLHLS